MGTGTTMVIDYEDAVYKYTPQGFSVEVGELGRVLAGGPRLNMIGFEDYRLDLRHWEIEKKKVSENGEWQTLYFRKRQPTETEIVKYRSTEIYEAYTAHGYEEIDGKFYIFSDYVGADVIDLSEWVVKKVSLPYPGRKKQVLAFTRKAS